MRRDKFEILTIARTPVVKTAILYGANLNSRRVNKYLTLLLEKDFVEKTGESVLLLNQKEFRIYPFKQ